MAAKSLTGFVTGTAKDCIKNFKDEEIEYLRDNPNVTMHHMGFGMYIRNHYIYGNDEAETYGEPDDISSMILEKIFSILLPDEFEYADSLSNAIFSNRAFLALRKEYKKKYGKYPVDFVKRAREEINLNKIEVSSFYNLNNICYFIREIADEMWNEEIFINKSENMGISRTVLKPYTDNIK